MNFGVLQRLLPPQELFANTSPDLGFIDEHFREGGLKATDELLKRAEVSYQAGTFAILDLLDGKRPIMDGLRAWVTARDAVVHGESVEGCGVLGDGRY